MEDFEVWIAKHPEVYSRVLHIASHAMDRGEKRLSMKGIFEDIRGEVRREKDSPVALNNNYTAPMTRKLIADYPVLKPLFRTRERTIR